MKHRVSFFGLGYVGLTTATCLANKDFQIIGFDIDSNRVKLINSCEAPFHEHGLSEILEKAVKNGTLSCTTDYQEAVLETDVTFITVGTPSRPDGNIDLTYVEDASRMIGEALRRKKSWHLVVVKSTVTPGTTTNIVKPLVEKNSEKNCGFDFGLCMNPEFLKEGSSIEDTFSPDRLIIGESDKKSGDLLEKFFKDFYEDKMPSTIRTTPENAELIKYANNAFLAMKVSFINMIANLCRRLPSTDVEVMARGIGLDKRINPLFLKAGAGWGGSCWGKDLKALKSFAEQLGINLPLVDSTLKINDVQPYFMVELAKELTGGLKKRRIAILGLSFKPDTDDMREAVSIKIVNSLVGEEAVVVVYDPMAMSNAKKIFGDKIEYAASVLDCLKNSDCALIVTEWNEFKSLAPEVFMKHMRIPAIVDCRRIYNPSATSSKLRFATVGLGVREYSNPALAVNTIVTTNSKVLLVKRSIEPFKEMWSLPGGFVEYDESVEDALIREVEEETGLRVKPKRVFNVYSHPLRSPVKHVVTICYLTGILGGTLRTSGENVEVKFFPLDQLPEQLAFDHHKIIKEYIDCIDWTRGEA
jgi:UDPglucose 6-dehydrogenase